MKFETWFLEEAGIQLIDGDRGKNYPKQDDFKESGYCLFLSAKNVTTTGFQFGEQVYIDKERDELLRAGKLCRGDIVVTTRGTIGNIAFYDETVPFENVRINSGMMIFRVNEDTWNRRLLYFLLTSEYVKQQIISLTSGSAVPQLPARDLKKFVLPKIPRDVQDVIAEVIGSVADKIELNRQINQTLEQIAQAIFKSWFVDFEPVKAKIEAKQNGQDPERAAMRAISGKTDEELDQLSPEQRQQLTTTAALFPDELEDSELGEIPKGWEVKPLSQMIELIGGGTPKRSEKLYWGGDIPWFSVKDAPAAGDVFVIDTDEKITESGLNKSSTKLLPEGVTIISARGTVGRLALVGVPMAMNQSCYGVKAGTDLGAAFNYFNLKHAISTLQQQTHGAVFDTITTGTFNSVYAIKPCVNSAKEFEKLVLPLLRRIKNNLFESVSLTECRDSLLPKLLSGEINMSEVA